MKHILGKSLGEPATRTLVKHPGPMNHGLPTRGASKPMQVRRQKTTARHHRNLGGDANPSLIQDTAFLRIRLQANPCSLGQGYCVSDPQCRRTSQWNRPAYALAAVPCRNHRSPLYPTAIELDLHPTQTSCYVSTYRKSGNRSRRSRFCTQI